MGCSDEVYEYAAEHVGNNCRQVPRVGHDAVEQRRGILNRKDKGKARGIHDSPTCPLKLGLAALFLAKGSPELNSSKQCLLSGKFCFSERNSNDA